MIRVLVIDDSAVMRAFLSRVVASQPDMELAGVVPDPLLAIERVRRHAPDVITLDVEMPGMNGLDFLRKLMAVRPLPVIMISSLTRRGADATLRALELGAVDFFPKPDSFEELESVAQDIAEKIRAASQARLQRRAAPAETVRQAPRPPSAPGRAAVGAVLGIGASTGGVEALRLLLAQLPGDMPPILVAQHMLPGFTETFARRLNEICPLAVKEAADGEQVLHGTVYIAPGGRHLVLARNASGYALRLTEDEPVNRHRPSVDTLFRSLARIAGAQAIGVMLTGMGADGAQGMLEMHKTGATTIAQDEATSVVFGMPRQAIAAGGVGEVMGLHEIAGRLRKLCGQEARTGPDGGAG
ncbi:MAG: chemotaxis response regulator protein-glutamate methylesterase [Burkholderiales bacterium]|nr:chemotaxis response regulator protein-glutamate methylesterase [Burkholderiales bacterium]